MEENVELYKIRTIGERISATSDFVRQNWNVFVKNFLPVGLFLAVLTGFFTHNYMQDVYVMMANPTAAAIPDTNWWIYGGMTISSMLFSLFICAGTGTILFKHAKGTLTPDTEWGDLKETFFLIAGKIFIIGCFFGLIFAVPAAIMSFFSGYFMAQGNILVAGLAMSLFLAAFFVLMIVLIPSLFLMQYPVYLEGASAWEGIKKGFKWGFNYWGSTFLSVFLGGLIFVVSFYILAMPYIVYVVYTALDAGVGGWVGYLLSALMFAVGLFLQTGFIIFIGFQYTSIASRLSCDN